jgi:hypothetical protein
MPKPMESLPHIVEWIVSTREHVLAFQKAESDYEAGRLTHEEFEQALLAAGLVRCDPTDNLPVA